MGRQTIAVVGTGSMGSMMSLLLMEQASVKVSAYDPLPTNRERAVKRAKDAGFESDYTAYDDHKTLCASLSKPRILVWSTPHGFVGDQILDSLDPYLEEGDVIIDAANEFYENTQRRQARAMNRGLHYIGTGVSGGYQSAREGPSLSPGGDRAGLEIVMPLLKKIAARDMDGNPCTAPIGPGGSGHYTKMVHNGIEQGIMSALCEIWGMMHGGLQMEYGEIADVWDKWNTEGELRDNFLVGIGVDICRTTDPVSNKYLLDLIKDKVVQDADDSEGTGFWTCEEGFKLHVPVPTIAAGHAFRLGSADANRRKAHSDALGGRLATPSRIAVGDREELIEDLRLALYGATLESFIQGLELLSKASAVYHWNIDFDKVISIWRGGCIIRSEYISELLLKAFEDGDCGITGNLLQSPLVAKEIKKTYASLKKVVAKGIEADAIIPSLSATLEHLKYTTAKEDLPTTFMEAQLDYFGEHMFDLRDGPGDPVAGPYHFGWKSAKSVPEPREITKSKD